MPDYQAHFCLLEALVTEKNAYHTAMDAIKGSPVNSRNKADRKVLTDTLYKLITYMEDYIRDVEHAIHYNIPLTKINPDIVLNAIPGVLIKQL